MEYLIIHNNEPVGKVVEPKADLGMGVVIGRFIPFPAYEKIRQICQIYAELIASGQTNIEYPQANDALHLSLTTISDLSVETCWIHIEDFSEYLGDDGYEAHFCISYDHDSFFSNTSLWEEKRV